MLVMGVVVVSMGGRSMGDGNGCDGDGRGEYSCANVKNDADGVSMEEQELKGDGRSCSGDGRGDGS